ncbi:hypothetical protein [Streptomyces cylindrosporus]|uniref:Uncharacterized protein n=1 Tax=Streptomyces cylindrosporus TaxID=2927583 RepID=A0ABS9YS85_9ACTN|nr:hypothetical protein [Streptomyces cylindrosporus]MCI3279091.1 hypothetical protein [Streptomyces cylindrosporus]
MIDKRPFTKALAALIAAATGKQVGEGRRPDGAGLSHYYILYALPGTFSGAPISDLTEDATLTYQVTSVSGPDPADPDSYGTQDQLQWLDDKARRAILERNPVTGKWLNPLAAPGIKVMSRQHAGEAGETPDATDAIMSSAQRFTFQVTSV